MKGRSSLPSSLTPDCTRESSDNDFLLHLDICGCAQVKIDIKLRARAPGMQPSSRHVRPSTCLVGHAMMNNGPRRIMQLPLLLHVQQNKATFRFRASGKVGLL